MVIIKSQGLKVNESIFLSKYLCILFRLPYFSFIASGSASLMISSFCHTEIQSFITLLSLISSSERLLEFSSFNTRQNCGIQYFADSLACFNKKLSITHNVKCLHLKMILVASWKKWLVYVSQVIILKDLWLPSLKDFRTFSFYWD